jgi:murein DD-endopeptidase MepM/ murein hydrolase activator NlpD
MRRWCTLLGIAFGPWVIALAYVLLVQGHTAAYNTYVNEYRKWPWRAGVSRYISTCPGQGPHQGQTWADDIDVGGGGASFPVHSVSSRGIVRFNGWDYDHSGGNMLVIQEEDTPEKYWVHYLHLAYPAIPPVGAWVYQGQRVADAGDTGGDYEIHLHFGLSPCEYKNCSSVSIYPIGGFADSSSCQYATPYPSDNAGIGDACDPNPDDADSEGEAAEVLLSRDVTITEAVPRVAPSPVAPQPPAALSAAGSGGLLAEHGSGMATWWYALAAGGALLLAVGAWCARRRWQIRRGT